VNTPVTANAGPDQTVCSAIAVSLNANAVTGGNWTGGAGSFNPNRNTANATYTPAVGEIGSTVTLIWNVPDPDGAGPCTAATDQMNIVVNTAVVANAALIKHLVVLHQSLLLLMQLLVVTGQVVLAHLLRIEILLMQLILLLRRNWNNNYFDMECS
jgi:hypothetical protein